MRSMSKAPIRRPRPRCGSRSKRSVTARLTIWYWNWRLHRGHRLLAEVDVVAVGADRGVWVGAVVGATPVAGPRRGRSRRAARSRSRRCVARKSGVSTLAMLSAMTCCRSERPSSAGARATADNTGRTWRRTRGVLRERGAAGPSAGGERSLLTGAHRPGGEPAEGNSEDMSVAGAGLVSGRSGSGPARSDYAGWSGEGQAWMSTYDRGRRGRAVFRTRWVCLLLPVGARAAGSASRWATASWRSRTRRARPELGRGAGRAARAVPRARRSEPRHRCGPASLGQRDVRLEAVELGHPGSWTSASSARWSVTGSARGRRRPGGRRSRQVSARSVTSERQPSVICGSFRCWPGSAGRAASRRARRGPVRRPRPRPGAWLRRWTTISWACTSWLWASGGRPDCCASSAALARRGRAGRRA